MPDQSTWKFVNTFAPWLSAVGTLAAVVVSLHLARRADRIKLAISSDTKGSKNWVTISVTNVTRRAATLNDLRWRPRWPFGTKDAHLGCLVAPGNWKFRDPVSLEPRLLRDGEENSFPLHISDLVAAAQRTTPKLCRHWPWMAARCSSLIVGTSQQKDFRVYLPSEVRQRLAQHLKEAE